MAVFRKIYRSLCLRVGAFLLLALNGCAQNPVTGKHDFVMLSEDSEIAIGRANHSKIIEQYGRYEDDALQKYVQSVGDRLAQVSHRDNLHYRFTVLDSPVINAFALPGGYIYITRGLMAYLNSEAELAAVLGHEIGHVTARHGVRQQSAAQAANLGYTLGSILFPELRAAPSQNLFNILGGALLSGYGREHELESDGLGAEYLARAGYEPEAMIDVIKVLKNQELFAIEQAKLLGQEKQQSGYHGLFASHPDNDTRLKEVVSAAEQYKTNQQRQVGRDVYLNHVSGMTFGDSEAQGIRSGRHFYHSDLQISLSFPEGWYIQNGQNALKATALDSQASIEVGVTDLNRKISPREFIEQRLKITKLLRGQVLNSHGLTGYSGIFENSEERLRVSVVYHRERAYVFFGGVKNQAQFDAFDNEFIACANSLHELTSEEHELAKGQKIEVVLVTKSDSYKNWSMTSPITNSPLTQLKLLNGDFPDGSLTAGRLAKRVR
jgi:predicted Zn-dependent protease